MKFHVYETIDIRNLKTRKIEFLPKGWKDYVSILEYCRKLVPKISNNATEPENQVIELLTNKVKYKWINNAT